VLSRWLGRFGLAFASLLLTFVVLEVAVRLLVPAPLWRFRDGTHDWQLDRELGWVNRPDLDVESVAFGALIRFRTNPDGLIPAAARRPRSPGTSRIMVFGDSVVVGRDVPQTDNYSAQLESILRERGGKVEVINAGVLGYSTDQALLLMQRWLPEYRPDLVIYGSTLNDFGGNALAKANAQAKPRFEMSGGELRLELPVLASEIQRLGGGPRTWIQQSAFYRAVQPRLMVLRARLGGSDQRLVMGDLDGLYTDARVRDSLDWELFAALLKRMQQVSRNHGAEFRFLAHPDAGEVWEPFIQQMCEHLGVTRSAYDQFVMQRRQAQVAAAHEIGFLSVVEPFLAQPERGPFHLLPYDMHLSVSGHRVLAEALADHMAGGELASVLRDAPGATAVAAP
jgi:lysophospholipase L1-like esterase